jgi:hypothetical protein
MAGTIPGSCPGTAMTGKKPISFPVMAGRSPGHPCGGRRAGRRRIAPGLRASLLQSRLRDDVDGRDKPGHDGQKPICDCPE